ncbi:protein CREG1 [Lucilia cuprina]|uniref:protein CREG1 n=1 Tax=Lucilia cuprina TaxID=7375 RepID=UPI001F0680AF|nr:protein CREG1 [Lucilia cuprina]
MLGKTIKIFLLLIGVYLEFATCYSAYQDALIIREYKRQLRRNATLSAPDLDHVKIARNLVHQANWASVGTISTHSAVKDYPMVNIISINDNDAFGQSTGRIRFLLTDLDFTGPDWQHNNKATFLFTDEQLMHCSKRPWPDNNSPIDPMEPTCARAIISGQVVKMDKSSNDYDGALVAFVERHPAAKNWLKAHSFYLCELNITNIFVLDYYGGPHTVNITDYYNTKP